MQRDGALADLRLRIFPDDRAMATLDLVELERYDSGAVLHAYDFTRG